MTKKLTLSVDQDVIARAKRYAEKRGTSVSRLVETFLAAVSEPPRTDDLSPVTRRLAGILKGSRLSRDDYREYLVRKYR